MVDVSETTKHADPPPWEMTMLPNATGAIFTDLDGTLLDSRQQVSSTNLACLHRLGEAGVVRVIATGRSHLSFQRVIPPGFPADYLIFSSGAGILELETGELLHHSWLEGDDVSRISSALERHNTDYMVHEQVPENHRFTYRRANTANTDFSKRIELYREYATDFSQIGRYPQKSAQVIAVLSGGVEMFSRIRNELNGYQVTRTTSPLDHRSIWMEIYPEHVHKGSGAAWLCRHLGIDPRITAGIGNDYNDLDLLDFTPHSHLLANAPTELHNRYQLAPANDHDGFSHAANEFLGQILPPTAAL